MAVIANMASARTISPLGSGLVDRGADRGLGGKSDQAADLGHQPAFGLTPMPLGDREDIPTAPRTSEEKKAHRAKLDESHFG